jgi:4-diphosphocytidyl-2-C-methyl-D-erythritol kinase
LLHGLQNDLTQAAINTAPEIKNVLSVLSDLDNQLLVRLTGSGGTCFALFDNTEYAHEAAEKLNKKFPDWWINPTSILP